MSLKVHKTERFDRYRVREPEEFEKSSFRTHDIGRPGFSKRVAGQLKSSGKWQTQSFLVSRKEPAKRKMKLLKSVRMEKKRIKFKRTTGRLKGGEYFVKGETY